MFKKYKHRDRALDFLEYRKAVKKEEEYQIAYRARNKDYAWKLWIKKAYGITAEQYEEMLQKQNYSCAICLRHRDAFKKRLSVDHNHRTGEIRGLLCMHCNTSVIGRETDGDKLARAADYLKQGTGWIVPSKRKRKAS